MKKNIYLVFLHSLGCTHKDLFDIFTDKENEPKYFFENITREKLSKYIKSNERVMNILEQSLSINIQKIEKTLKNLEVTLIAYWDNDYPESLKNIPHSPYLLYIRWKLPKEDMFGVVGSRKISSYGIKCIEKIVPDITKIFPIVSGGAAGCDTKAHKTTVNSTWKTVVVVGTGIDQTYPMSNEKLFNEIVASHWAILSIFRIEEPWNPYNFPVRNEIVVWLSRWILIVEAQRRSWSLITAGLCLDLGKDLFAIPGDITHSGSQGTNMLIKKWEAKCVTQSLDVLEEYDILIKQSSHKKKLPLLDDLESKIYQNVSQEDYNVDEIWIKLWKDTSEITMKLSILELKKLIKKNISGKYTLL